MKTIGIFLTALAILNACETENLPQTENKINVDKTTREIIQADNDFGITLFKEVAASDAERIMYSFLRPAWPLRWR